MPPLIKRCIDSQKSVEGYEHKIITLENCYRGSRYVNEALAMAEKTGSSKFLVKAVDWLRAYHVYEEGGVYLDADTEVLAGKNFDAFLDNGIFVVYEDNYKQVCNGIFGAEKGSPLLKEYTDRIENNYRGDGNMVLRPGLQGFNDVIWAANHEGREGELRMKICLSELFFPYRHETGMITSRPETITYHHYARTWCVGDSKNMII